jgi:hypothetical protein
MKKEYVTFVRRMRDLNEGKEILFIKDLTPGSRKYDTRLVRADLSRQPDKLPDGDVLWIRSETGRLQPQPWAIKVLEELPPYVPGQPWQDLFVAMRQLKTDSAGKN